MLILCALTAPLPAIAAPTVSREKGRVLVRGEAYRATFTPEIAGFDLELKGGDGQWRPVTAKSGGLTFGVFRAQEELAASGQRATWALQEGGGVVVVGQQVALDTVSGLAFDLHCIATDQGLLLGVRLAQRAGAPQGVLWAPPRIALNPEEWEGYRFSDSAGRVHQGRIAGLDPCPAYAGVSAWEQQGDTAPALDPKHPALILRAAGAGSDLGVAYVDLAGRWARSRMFLQRHTPAALYLYSGYSPADAATQPIWAWLAPFPKDETAAAAHLERLQREGQTLVARFQPISKAVPEAWRRPLADFPAGLKRAKPVDDINEAAVYTMGEATRSNYGVELARKVGADVIIRGWFKWNQAPPVDELREIPRRVHAAGALFGGGITCSALYDHENGISQAQLLDMATRGPDGQLVDAWGQPGVRHGSLSSPAYLDYLFRWCREQIDAGVDCLFMDEHTAALSDREGYDDYSLADFRRYLLRECPQTQGWAPADARWAKEYQVDLADRAVCPDGTMASFDYRAYLRAKGLLARPGAPGGPLAELWHQARAFRDDRAWKSLTDRIRAYARQQGRNVLIDANGLARYVDLQVLGVWDKWAAADGHINLAENQLPYWRSLVRRGHQKAEKRVPVVLFHDWGMGDVPFPWMAVPASERELWMRTRGAEIYAAGAFFAFPVLGPFGCDAARDGSLPEIARQTAFYQAQRDLYLRGRYLTGDALQTKTEKLSLAAWWCDTRKALALHVINRDVADGALRPRQEVRVWIPVASAPDKITVVSPDWDDERAATWRAVGDGIEVALPGLNAYAVALLHYPGAVDLSRLHDSARVILPFRWARPARAEFRVRPGGEVSDADGLEGCLQGMLHTGMRNPPTFLTNAQGEGKLLVKVRAVASVGARLEYRVDGKVQQTVDLPDRDGQNAGDAPEYDQVFTFPVPAGPHRLTLDNVGGDWASLSWLEFQGSYGEWQ